MSATEDLLAEIWANPEDDAPRLVYADRLTERGDPRGELIQLQCQLHTRRHDETADWQHTHELHDRAQALWKEHGAAWRAPLGVHAEHIHFERGFPHTLIALPAAFLAAKHLIMTEPIREAVFPASIRDRIREIATAPELDRLVRIEHDQSDRHGSSANWALGDDAFAQLCAARLSSLRVLSVAYNRIGPRGARALAAAPWLSQLDRLALRGNPILDEGVIAIAPRIAGVRELDLHDTAIEDAAAIALGGLRNVTWLRASYGETNPDEHRFCERITEAGAKALGRLTSLRRLDLDRAWVRDGGAIALAHSAAARTLVDLNLGNNQIGDAGAAAIAAGFPALLGLGLSGNAIGAAGATALAASTALASLRWLDLNSNSLGFPGVTALANGTGLPAVLRLAVGWNKLYTGEVRVHDDYDEQVEESYAETRARFANKPGWRIE